MMMGLSLLGSISAVGAAAPAVEFRDIALRDDKGQPQYRLNQSPILKIEAAMLVDNGYAKAKAADLTASDCWRVSMP